MTCPLLRLAPLLLIVTLIGAACAPLGTDDSAADRARIAALQQKLQQLQGQLADLETAPAPAPRGWQPLLADSAPPAGRPGYAYLLYAGLETTEGLKRLSSLLDQVGALPADEASVPSPALLVPLTAEVPRPTLENYDFAAARALLARADLPPLALNGPLLLATAAPLVGPPDQAVLFLPGQTAGADLAGALRCFRDAAGAAPLPTLAWDLLWQAAPGSLTAERRGAVLVLRVP